MSKTFEEQQEIDFQRQQIVDKAVDAADRIILDGSDGSNEETNYLTAKVADRFVSKALNPFISAMMKKDLELP